jgi:hypothetical protein
VKSSFKSYLTQEYVKECIQKKKFEFNWKRHYLNFIAKGYDVTQNGDLIMFGYIEYQGTGTLTVQRILMIRMFLLFFMVGILKGGILC